MNIFRFNKSINNLNKLDSLDDKITYYLEWCKKNDDDFDEKEVKKIIDKMSVWYELRYPDLYFDHDDIDSVMFANFDKHDDWSMFYTFDKFYFSLSSKEKRLLDKPCFVDMIYLNSGRSHIHFNQDGSVSDASDIILFDKYGKHNGKYLYGASELLDGKTIDEWPSLMKENRIIADYNKIDYIVGDFKKRIRMKDGLFDAIMFNIIERGGKYYGPRRGVLFAREFERDVRIPVSYGDSSLALEYLSNDGEEDLMCFKSYFDGDLQRQSIKDILSNQNLVGLDGKQKKKVFPKSCE